MKEFKLVTVDTCGPRLITTDDIDRLRPDGDGWELIHVDYSGDETVADCHYTRDITTVDQMKESIADAT